jgi:hypothetical protein
MMQDVTAELVKQIGAGAASVDGKSLLLKVPMDGQEGIALLRSKGMMSKPGSHLFVCSFAHPAARKSFRNAKSKRV